MSALGDYVHFNIQNYTLYGTHRKGQNANNHYVPINNYLSQRTASLKKIDKATLDQLKYNIAADSETANKRAADDMQKKWQDMINAIYQYLAQFTSKGLIGQLQGEKKKGKDIYTKFRATGEGYKGAKKAALQPSQIQDKKNIKNQIDKMIDDINSGKIEATSDNLKKVIQLYNKLGLGKISTRGKNPTVLEDIESNLIDLAYDTAINALAGDFGEYLVYAAGGSLDRKARTMANGAVEGVVGRQQSEITFNANDVVIDLNEYDSKTFSYSDKFTKEKYVVGTSQDKVDVQVIINQEDVFASVKNYRDLTSENYQGKVKLQSNLSLLYTLIYLNNTITDFGNHWLNMHALNFSGAGRQNIDEVLNQEIAYEALVSGNPLKNNSSKSNTFVVIDRFSGKVYAESTVDMLLDQNKFNNFRIYPKIDTIYLNNTWASTYEQRISKMLLDVHNIKMSISYKILNLPEA